MGYNHGPARPAATQVEQARQHYHRQEYCCVRAPHVRTGTQCSTKSGLNHVQLEPQRANRLRRAGGHGSVRTCQAICNRTGPIIAGAVVAMMALAAARRCEADSPGIEQTPTLSPRTSIVRGQPQSIDGTTWTRTSVTLGATLGVVIIGIVLAKRIVPGLATGTERGPIQILCQT